MTGFHFQGYTLEATLLVASILLTFSVLASRVWSMSGIPSLLLFLGIGMLAGSEGPGGIEFDDYSMAFGIGSVCLALIIFDGGLRTSWKQVRPILPVGISLSILGTLVTGAITSLFAHYALGIPWMESLLLGAIVSSTDAAAVFSILRSRSLSLKSTLKHTLEFEAGSNDPVAIFLTMSVLSFAAGKANQAIDLGMMLLLQGGVGFFMGWIGGKSIRWLIHHVGIEYEGLYGVLLLGLIIFLFAATSMLNGSGFLAVYVAGLVIGNAEMIHKNSIIQFHDGMSWIAHILVFLTLGLLVFPSHLLQVWKEGLLLSVFMMFIARPLSVKLVAPHRILEGKEKIFISWVGLRGAAPIILATLPWGVGISRAEFIFNLVFFVVLTSVLVQGISIPWFAKKLGITIPLDKKTYL